jgi:glycine/D-amino acid oxidase-like deaminating enzyme
MSSGAQPGRPLLPQSYWAATAGPAPETPALEGERTVDVCVVGAGFVGLSASLHLAEAGASVVLLDAAEPGWGASGRNGGQIIPGFKAERSELAERLGEEPAERLFSWSGGFVDFTLALIRKHKIDCGAGQPGWIQPAHSLGARAAFERRVKEWQDRGARVEILDARKTADLLGTDWYCGSVLDHRGGRLHPLSYSRGLARAAQRAGASVHGGSPVRKIERADQRWRVETERGVVLADQVLLCTNAYSAMVPEFSPALSRSVVPVLSYMVATGPLSHNLRASILPQGQTAADLKRLTNHFRVEPDGRLLFGGRGALTEGDDRTKSALVQTKLFELFPHLKGTPLEFFWSGKVALTLDHLPHIHQLAPGLTAALGCNGRGVGMGTAMGKVVCDLARGGSQQDCPVPITPLKRIPLHGARLPAMQATVWWKGLRDKVDHDRARKVG